MRRSVVTGQQECFSRSAKNTLLISLKGGIHANFDSQMKEDPIKSFRNAFQGFLKEENLEHTYKQKQVIADWERIMGKTISSRTTKMFFNQKTLFVKLSSAPLKSEMQNSKAQIIELIEKEIGKGEVEDVRFL